MNVSARVLQILRRSLGDILILAVISAILSVDITRLGNIYTIDNNIFPYYYDEVRYKYLVFALYGYYPWLGSIAPFDIATFLINFPIYIISYLPYSSVFYEFFLLSIGMISTYKLITETIPDDRKYISRIAGYSGALFFVLNPQGAGGLTSFMLTSVYVYAFLPLLLYILRKYFLEENLYKALFWLLIGVPITFFEYYMSIPVYALPYVIFFSVFYVFYSIKAIMNRHYIRVVVPIILSSVYLTIELSYITQLLNSFISQDFIKLSYNYWVANAKAEGLGLTLRGINTNFGLPPLNVYYFTLLVVLIYSFILITKRALRSSEPIFIFTVLLLFTFLYSMPNVPFSSFWERLFFEFPIMVDLRTQYVIITPFQGFIMSIAFGLGSYYFMKSLTSKRSLRLVAMALVFLTIIGVGFSMLAYGSPNVVFVPQDFLKVSNFINQNASYNATVLVLPIFNTEDSQSWYHGPSLFPLFLKPLPILGGYYYSASGEMFKITNNVYFDIYRGNVSNESLNYVRNFFYLFNVKYVIVEKTARPYGPLWIFSPYGSYSYHNFMNGIENYTRLNVIKLAMNNSLYSVYSTGVDSSIGFLAYENYSIDYLLKSDNITKLLIPIQVIYISPTEYILKIPEQLINQSSVYYLYLMIPYNKGWSLTGATVLSHTNYYGYNIFKIKIENNTIYLNNPEVNNSLKSGMAKVLVIFVLPIVLAFISLILSSRAKEPRLNKIIKYF